MVVRKHPEVQDFARADDLVSRVSAAGHTIQPQSLCSHHLSTRSARYWPSLIMDDLWKCSYDLNFENLEADNHCMDELWSLRSVILVVEWILGIRQRRTYEATPSEKAKRRAFILWLVLQHVWRLSYIINSTNVMETRLSKLLASTKANKNVPDRWGLMGRERKRSDPGLLHDIISKVSNEVELEKAIACAKSISTIEVVMPGSEESVFRLLLAYSRLQGGAHGDSWRSQTVTVDWLETHMSGLSTLMRRLITEYRSLIEEHLFDLTNVRFGLDDEQLMNYLLERFEE